MVPGRRRRPRLPRGERYRGDHPTDADPYAPARKQTEILQTADRLRVLLPAIDRDSTETITEQVTGRGLAVETVLSPGVESTAESADFAPLMREKIETGRSLVLVAQESPPFYLGLTDDDRIRAWADGVYEDYREPARIKPASEF